MTSAEVKHLLNWGPPRSVNTRRGPRLLREAEIVPDFWDVWRNQKDELKEAGVSVSKDDETDQWKALWWEDPAAPEGNSKPVSKAKVPERISSVMDFPEDTDLATYAPLAGKILHDYQKPAALTQMSILSNHDFSIESSDMGMGKTYIAGAVAEYFAIMDYSVAVICPANVKDKWNAALEQFGVAPLFVESFNKLRNGSTQFLLRSDRQTTSGKVVHELKWCLPEDTLVIVDEVHYCSALKSINAEMLNSLLDTRGVKVMGLSGTVASDPTQLKVVGRGLGLHDGRNFWKWCLAHGCEEGKWGGIQFTTNKSLQHQHLTAIHRHIYPNRGSRLLKSELKHQLPPQLVQPEKVSVSQDFDEEPECVQVAMQLVLDAELADMERAEEKSQESGQLVEVAGFTKDLRARQLAELLLVRWTVETAVEAWREGNAVVIFCLFEETIASIVQLIHDETKATVLEYHGQISVDQRKRNLDDFQNNRKRFLVANLGAGAQSIDMHDTLGTAPRLGIIMPTYSSKLLLQAMGRFDRSGKKTPSVIKLPFASGVQEKVMTNVQGKLDNLALLQDGDLNLKVEVHIKRRKKK
jgi:hypothetical protein